MNTLLSHHWHHHAKLYLSLGVGILGLGVAYALHLRLPLAIGGDLFFLSYIAAFSWTARSFTAADLRERAKVEDEGAFLVSLIILLCIAYTCGAIFATLNDKGQSHSLWLVIVLSGAPLGWFVIHLNEALHYSNIYYSDRTGKKGALDFHDDKQPGIAEFMYFSLVIGMTA